jgi:hypothetical protein
MRRLAAVAFVGLFAFLGLAPQASAVAITNGTVSLGVNPQGDLNWDAGRTLLGVTYVPTGNDGTRAGEPWEGWGTGANGPVRFEGHANEEAGDENYRQISFTSTASDAVSVVDVLRADVPALRLTQDFHPSPTTPNLYEITTTLENVSGGPLTDVRYERDMDWDVEPSAFSEFVTINRGATPPENLLYSDDNGFADNNPFSTTALGTDNGPLSPATVNADFEDSGPADHGARFRFAFGDLATGESKQFFLYYGAAGNETDADAAVSAAALEVFSYGQPSQADGDDPGTLRDPTPNGTPNTFIWGFRAVGGSAVIPPTLSLTPASGSSVAGASHSLTATLIDSGGTPVPGAKLVFAVSGANPTGGAGTTDANGQAGFSYGGANAGDDSIVACLDANESGACDADEVFASASQHWDAPPLPPVVVEPRADPEPVLGRSVVTGVVSGTVRVKTKNGKFRTLRADQTIPLGSTVDATKGRVRVTSAVGGGKTQTADFYQGSFVITQTRGARPITQLALNGKLSCATKKKGGKAGVSAKRKKRKVRRLWGDGKGRFRTKGKYGAATVRGTKWLTEDRCGRTLVRVKRGTVVVRDFTKRKNKVVKKGRSYVARR